MSYPRSYHAAMSCLIRYYPVADSQDERLARSAIARALRELRKGPSVYSTRDNKRITSRERARRERDHMLFVNPGPFTKERPVMNRTLFNVTYDIVTPESAEHGDTAERGFIAESVTLRDALEALHSTRTSAVDGVTAIETDSMPCVRPRWITVTNGMEFKTGAVESRAIHIPDSVTASSARRIARLAGAKLR